MFDFKKLDETIEKKLAEAKREKQKLMPIHWLMATSYKIKITFLGSLNHIGIYSKKHNDTDNMPIEIEQVYKKEMLKLAHKIIEVYE